MSHNLSDFVAQSVQTLPEALRLLAEPADSSLGPWRPLAGGTDLMVSLAAGTLPAGRYIDIWPLDELRGITVTDQAIELGALTTYTEIRRHAQLRTEFPLLGLAAKETGAIAIQNRGTLGGNIANASPAADTPPALLAYDAELELTSLSGVRTVAYSQFHSGYKQMDRRPGELITKIRLRRPPSDAPGRTVHYYRKVGTRAAQAISKVCLAAFARIDGARLLNIRLGLGSVAPIPLRCTRTESVLLSAPLDEALIRRAEATLAYECSPIDDVRSTSAYRRRVTLNLLRELLLQCRSDRRE
jgi:CO/xanthine dehydrogenase FAD-binding subunit